jgi:hypothetical protein
VRLTRPKERTAAGAGEEGLAFDPPLPDGAFDVVGCAGVLDVQVSLFDGPMARWDHTKVRIILEKVISSPAT